MIQIYYLILLKKSCIIILRYNFNGCEPAHWYVDVRVNLNCVLKHYVITYLSMCSCAGGKYKILVRD